MLGGSRGRGRGGDDEVLSGPAKIAEYGGGQPRSDLKHMVMVAGHAIWMGGETMGVNEDEWCGCFLLMCIGCDVGEVEIWRCVVMWATFC